MDNENSEEIELESQLNANNCENIWANDKIWSFLILLIFGSGNFGNDSGGHENQNDSRETTKPD